LIIIFLLVYIDDIIVASSSASMVSDLLSALQKDFTLKDLGSLHYFLGVEVKQNKDDLHLSQKKYIMDLLQPIGMINCKPVTTLLATSTKLSAYDGDLLSSEDATKYRNIVGAMQYLTLTRPDIAYAINKVCQYLHAPRSVHWTTVFLKYSIDYVFLIWSSPSTIVSAFSDANWAGCTDDRKSTSGFAVFLGPNLISWSAKKQKIMSRLSTKAEYKSMADATVEIMWLQSVLHELHVPCPRNA
jgi:hypothetical protein